MRLVILPPLVAFAILGACSAEADRNAPPVGTSGQGVEPATIAAALSGLPEFSGMRALLSRAGLSPMMASPRTAITLFAPRDTAFALLGPQTRTAISGQPPATLLRVMRSMMIARPIHAEELRTRIIDAGGALTIESMAGSPLDFRVNGNQMVVTGPNGGSASIGTTDLATGNGTIYVLDHWIGPAG